MLFRDTDDDVTGHVVPFTTQGKHVAKRRIKTTTPRGLSLNTIACERIAVLRADELLIAGDNDGALSWLRHANEHRARNRIMRSATIRQ